MFDTAADLEGRGSPHVPIRQWVVPLSRQVRYHPAADPKLASEVARQVQRTLFAWPLSDFVSGQELNVTGGMQIP